MRCIVDAFKTLTNLKLGKNETMKQVIFAVCSQYLKVDPALAIEPARATDDLAILPALEYVDAARISLEAVFCVEEDAILVSCVLAVDCATFTMFFLQIFLQKI